MNISKKISAMFATIFALFAGPIKAAKNPRISFAAVVSKLRALKVQIEAHGAFSSRNIWVNRAGLAAGAMVAEIIGLMLAAYVAAYTIPSAIAALANQTNWANTPAVIQNLGGLVLPIVIIVALVVMLLKAADIA